jgi:hypothetical protein
MKGMAGVLFAENPLYSALLIIIERDREYGLLLEFNFPRCFLGSSRRQGVSFSLANP